jgi:protocatechuate 3,4-dioxygenase beta subunit
MVAFATVLWAVVVSQSVPASPSAAPPPATGLIVGRVVDGTSHRPIPGAIVTLAGAAGAPTGQPQTQPRAMTNANGQFVFRKLAKGTYRLTAIRVGYTGGASGQRRPGGSSLPLQLDDGQRAGDVVIAMWKYAAITGTVVDEAGEPLIGVTVRAYQRRVVAGRPHVRQAAAATTDDRGVYRLGTLVPGTYLVAFVWHEASVPTATADLFRNGLPNDPKLSEILRERLSIGSSLAPLGATSAIQVGGAVRDLANGVPVPPPDQENGPLYIYPTQFYPGVPGAATRESGSIRPTCSGWRRRLSK